MSRSTLRDGVFELGANTGEVLGVVSTLGAVTTVSFGAEDGSSASLALVVIVVGDFAGAPAFILALDLVGGMYFVAVDMLGDLEGRSTAKPFCSVSECEGRSQSWAAMFGGASAVTLTAAKSGGIGIRHSAVSSEQLGCSGCVSSSILEQRGGRGPGNKISRFLLGPVEVRAQGWNGAVSLVSHHEWVNLDMQATP